MHPGYVEMWLYLDSNFDLISTPDYIEPLRCTPRSGARCCMYAFDAGPSQLITTGLLLGIVVPVRYRLDEHNSLYAEVYGIGTALLVLVVRQCESAPPPT